MMRGYEQSESVMRDLGLSVTAWNTRVIVQEALNRGIEVHRLGPNGGVKLVHDGKTHRWRDAITSINSRLVKRVAMHKEVASRLLRAEGLPGLENAIFSPGEELRAWSWAEPLGSSVIKPHDAKRGAGVHMDIRSRETFTRAFRRVAEKYGSVLVERYQKGTEYRFLLVNGKLIGVINRRPASVVGDGSTSIQDLVRQKNLDRGPIHKQLRLGDPELRILAGQEMRASSVPESGRRIFLRNALNIHYGGDAVEASTEIAPGEVTVMERVAEALPGAGLLGIDAVVPRQKGEAEIGIIEVNAAPLISMHHFPWEGESVDVAGAIVQTMFPRTQAPG